MLENNYFLSTLANHEGEFDSQKHKIDKDMGCHENSNVIMKIVL